MLEILTPQQTKVSDGILRGLSNREIALELNLKEKTVKCYIRDIFQKTDCLRRAQFIVKFIKD